MKLTRNAGNPPPHVGGYSPAVGFSHRLFRPQKRPPAATAPNNPNASLRPPFGESEKSVRKFAHPLQDARFCGLKAALRLHRYG